MNQPVDAPTSIFARMHRQHLALQMQPREHDTPTPLLSPHDRRAVGIVTQVSHPGMLFVNETLLARNVNESGRYWQLETRIRRLLRRRPMVNSTTTTLPYEGNSRGSRTDEL